MRKPFLQSCAIALILTIGMTGAYASSAQSTKKTPPTPPNGVNIKFDSFPKGPAAQMVNKLWRQDPEYADYISIFNMVPSYTLGLIDINGDKKPEVFARHSDPELGFCVQDSPACEMRIYANTTKGLIEIGRFMTADPVRVLSEKTNGINNILVFDAELNRVTYVWDGKAYKKK